MSHPECMICGSQKHVLREGKLCLCARCIGALGDALGQKLEKPAAPPPKRHNFPFRFLEIPPSL